ncbi:MAG: hypothetical protein LC798_00395 [Chloroflexi bacterium]|nr:hypothetical protein [Chloroflexota bacterium]
MTEYDRPFNEEDLYEQFPEGREGGHGTEAGFNTIFRLNDASLFRPELLDESNDAYIPVLSEFVKSGEEISISFVEVKSSSRESEWFLHKPHLTFDAENQKQSGGLPKDLDIAGSVDRYPGPEHAHITTLIINHEMTMARWKQSIIVMEDGKAAGQMIYKHPPPDEAKNEDRAAG